jgi:hypothetical protein
MSHAACPYQISAKSDELMRSSGGNDVGSEGGKINFLSPNHHFAPFSTNSEPICFVWDSIYSPNCRASSQHEPGSLHTIPYWQNREIVYPSSVRPATKRPKYQVNLLPSLSSNWRASYLQVSLQLQMFSIILASQYIPQAVADTGSA